MSDNVIDADLAKFVVMHEKAEKEEAQAELKRLTALLEDRPSLAMEIRKAIHDWDGNREIQEKFEHSTFVADRLIAYLKPLG